MTRTTLMDVLAPPLNHWLRGLARCKNNLPEGVRVVRFGDRSDDDDEAPPWETATN